MVLSRRAIIATLAFCPVACATPRLGIRPELVQTYDPARETALYPAGPPLIALYQSRARTLAWVAAVHSPTPATPTAELVRGAIAHAKPRAVVLEGFPTSWGPNPARIMSRVAQLPPDLGDEGDVAVRTASAIGADVWGGEPSDAELASALAVQGFAPADLFYTAFFGPLEQDQRNGAFASPRDPAFDAAFMRLASELAPSYRVPSDASPAAFRAWFKTQFGVRLEDDPEWYARGWPGKQGVSSAIARASNHRRDIHAYTTIIERLEADNRVVVVFGASHLSSVWAALVHTLGPPRVLRSV